MQEEWKLKKIVSKHGLGKLAMTVEVLGINNISFWLDMPIMLCEHKLKGEIFRINNKLKIVSIETTIEEEKELIREEFFQNSKFKSEGFCDMVENGKKILLGAKEIKMRQMFNMINFVLSYWEVYKFFTKGDPERDISLNVSEIMKWVSVASETFGDEITIPSSKRLKSVFDLVSILQGMGFGTLKKKIL